MSSETTITRREALKRGVTLGGAALVWVTPATQAFAMSNTVAQAASGVNQGCTPGFWKNNTGAWEPTGLAPNDSIRSALFGGGSVDCAEIDALLNQSLLQGLNFGGGDTLAGAAMILLRAAIAALLNTSHPGVDHGYSTNVRAEVQAVLSGECGDLDRDQIIGLATALDSANNAGCPLNADGAAN